MNTRKMFPIVALAALFAALGCAIDSGTAPNANVANDVLAATSATDKSAAEALRDALKAAHDRLIAARDSIKKEQKANRERNKAAFDSLKMEWKEFKKEWAEYKKDNKLARVELLRCAPLEYSGDAEVIGPNGGEIKVGPHKLVIPKGALATEQLIVAEAPMGSLVRVTFQPHGLRFSVRSQLTLSYAHCMRPDSFTYRIAYVDDNGKTILEFPPSADDKTLKAVNAGIDHFSSYVVAY
jgi:hypothetical protein